MKPIGFVKARAKKILEERNIDVLIASSPENNFYASGLPTLHVAKNPILFVLQNQYPTLTLIRQDGEECLITWMLYQSANLLSWVDDIRGIGAPQMALKYAIDIIAEWHMETKSIGLETSMPRYQAEYLREKLPDATFVSADEAFIEMRLIKTSEEVERIRKSTEIAEKAIKALIGITREGVLDEELLLEARKTIISEGAEGWDHLTIGLGMSDPEAPGYVGAKMGKNDLARYDIGAIWKGYVSDVSRHCALSSSIGEKEHELMVQIQEFCVNQIQPGSTASEVIKATKKYAKTLDKKLTYFITGHSIGLQTEEFHFFSPMMRKGKGIFEENMVLDVEVWTIYKESLLGIEDTYQVTHNGCKQLSSLPKRIFTA
ncbi:MAG: M24 family metallopeptidase [Candidatus Helarchaeota archaeon]